VAAVEGEEAKEADRQAEASIAGVHKVFSGSLAWVGLPLLSLYYTWQTDSNSSGWY
jgi:hypothetical protein